MSGDDIRVDFILIIYDVTARSVVIGRQAAADAVIGQCVDSAVVSHS